MTTHQAAAVIREAIRDAAKEVGCKPSDAHDPPTANRAGIAARNLAIVSAHRQGVSKDQLCEAFRRSWETVNNVLLQDVRNVQGHPCRTADGIQIDGLSASDAPSCSGLAD